MLQNLLEINGVYELNKKELQSINGGNHLCKIKTTMTDGSVSTSISSFSFDPEGDANTSV